MRDNTPETGEEVDSYKDILQELIDELVVVDSLGVFGTGFKVCCVCSEHTHPGSGEELVHDEVCPVGVAIQRAIELERGAK